MPQTAEWYCSAADGAAHGRGAKSKRAGNPRLVEEIQQEQRQCLGHDEPKLLDDRIRCLDRRRGAALSDDPALVASFYWILRRGLQRRLSGTVRGIMGFLTHVVPVVLHCLACSADDGVFANRMIVQVQSGTRFDHRFAAKVNALRGGESPQQIKRLLGPPQQEDIQCSKDFECKRKHYLVGYCYPDVENCKSYVDFWFNNNRLPDKDDRGGLLYGISSNVPEISPRDFDSYAPDWWLERKAGDKATKK